MHGLGTKSICVFFFFLLNVRRVLCQQLSSEGIWGDKQNKKKIWIKIKRVSCGRLPGNCHGLVQPPFTSRTTLKRDVGNGQTKNHSFWPHKTCTLHTHASNYYCSIQFHILQTKPNMKMGRRWQPKLLPRWKVDYFGFFLVHLWISFVIWLSADAMGKCVWGDGGMKGWRDEGMEPTQYDRSEYSVDSWHLGWICSPGWASERERENGLFYYMIFLEKRQIYCIIIIVLSPTPYSCHPLLHRNSGSSYMIFSSQGALYTVTRLWKHF